MEQQNILIFSDYGAPYKGNYINSITCLEDDLKKSEANVVYLFPARTKNRDWVNDMNEQGKIINFLGDNFVKNIFLIRKLLVKYNIDVFYINFYSSKALFMFDIASVFLDVKQIIHLHNIVSEYNFIKKPIFNILKKNKSFIGCSKATTLSGIKAGIEKNRIYTIPNAIDFSRLDHSEIINRHDLNIALDSKIILMFGYSYKIKGIDLALQAIEQLRNFEDIHLLISVSSNVDELKKYINSYFGVIPSWIHILKPRNDVASLYRLADVFLSASREEGFCYSLVEAAYCQTDIVASKIPAQEELVLPNAFWFKSEDAEELRLEIEKSLRKPRSEALKIQQKKLVYQNYDISSWTNQVKNILLNT